MYSKGQGKAGVTLIPRLKCLLYFWQEERGGRAWWQGWQLAQGTPLRPASAQASYLESLLMTRMRAPFSSFSLWLSDFSSVKICSETKRRWDYTSALAAGRALRPSGIGRDGAARWPGRQLGAWLVSFWPPKGHSSRQSFPYRTPSTQRAFNVGNFSATSPGFLQTGHRVRRGQAGTRAQ